ncbi:MAG: hypothetical protein MK002_04235 [Alphaproteobacteria bacterium]|nr:hypothetical protein [Alphaproteobacteria bacterium]
MKNILYSFLFFLFFNSNFLFAIEIIINEEDWPCKVHHLEAPKQSDYWPGKNISLDSKWKDDPEVKELVDYITNHANSIDYGKKAVDEFSKKFDNKKIKEEKFNLVFSGIFQEMSLYLSLAKHGVFQFITRIQLLEKELIKQNLKDKKLEKRSIGRSKKGWVLEIADDSEEEAEFQCNRMDFLERKAKTLTNQLITNL